MSITEEITAKLAELGATAEDIAARLEELGITGSFGGGQCPLCQHLQRACPDAQVTFVACDAVLAGSRHTQVAPLNEAQREFVRLFDNAAFPQLYRRVSA